MNALLVLVTSLLGAVPTLGEPFMFEAQAGLTLWKTPIEWGRYDPPVSARMLITLDNGANSPDFQTYTESDVVDLRLDSEIFPERPWLCSPTRFSIAVLSRAQLGALGDPK